MEAVQPSQDDSKPRTDSERAARLLRALLWMQLLSATIFFSVCVGGLVFVDRIELIPSQTEALITTAMVHGAIAVCAVLGVALVNRFRRMKPFWPQLMLVILILYGAVTVDRVLAIVYPRADKHVPIITRHPSRGWFHRVNAEGFGSGCYITTNELGLRDRPMRAQKAQGDLRILFVGDSITFGFVLGEGERISRQAEMILNERDVGRRVRCINAGVAGYTTWQELDLLREIGPMIQPDAVVLQFCINDMIDVIGIGRKNPELADLAFSLNTSSHWSGTWRAISYHAAVRRNRELADRRAWAQNDPTRSGHPTQLEGKEDIYLDPLPESVQQAWDLCLEDLTSIKTVCDDMGVPLILVYSPEVCQFDDDPKYRQPSIILGDWAKQQNVPFVDVSPIWKGAIQNGTPSGAILYDTIHPRPIAAKMMAEAIAEALEDVLSGE